MASFTHTIPILYAFIILFNLAAFCDACSCFPTTIRTAYYAGLKNGAPLSIVKVIGKDVREKVRVMPGRPADKLVYYWLQVTKVYGGCSKKKVPYCVVAKSESFASCGYVNLQEGSTYVLPIKQSGLSTLGTCTRQFRYTTPEVKKFLDSRSICCNGRCKCSSFVARCVASPCSVTRPSCPDAVKCKDNYCGGCNAEFFNSKGEPACARSHIF